MRRLLVLVAASGCGSKAEHGTPVTAPGLSFVATVPTEAVGKLVASDSLPPAYNRLKPAFEHFKVLRFVEVVPATPGVLTVDVTACAPDKMLVATLPEQATPDVLPAKLVDGKLVARVDARVDKLGALAVLCPVADLVGTPQQVLRGTPDVLLRPDCNLYITPETPVVKALTSDPKRFAIDAEGNLLLEPKLAVRGLDEAGELAKADEVITRGGGDEVSLSVAYASLLAAKGHAVMLIGGAIPKGVTGWTVAMIDKKPMFVDVRQAKLVPLDEATKARGLTVHRGCAWYEPGGSTDPMQFALPQDLPATSPPPPRPDAPDANALLDQRKQLDKKCNHGADKTACMERGKVDDELKKQLDALLVRHKDLETRCKANKDADACAKRELVAEQGKAIKAQLDAKP